MITEIKVGDYIEKSELDTEQKYNDAVEVFGLFGCSIHERDYKVINGCNAVFVVDSDYEFIGTNEYDRDLKRKLTYNQVMAIGKLKRMIDKKSAPKSAPKIGADNGSIATQYLNRCINVQKERGEQYDNSGSGERSFNAAAKAFNSLTGEKLSGSNICLLLTCLKVVRQNSDKSRVHDDSLLDGISYLSLWAEELTKELK